MPKIKFSGLKKPVITVDVAETATGLELKHSVIAHFECQPDEINLLMKGKMIADSIPICDQVDLKGKVSINVSKAI